MEPKRSTLQRFLSRLRSGPAWAVVAKNVFVLYSPVALYVGVLLVAQWLKTGQFLFRHGVSELVWTFTDWIIACALLLLVVIAHELGHWTLLRLLGVGVKYVSVGAGPEIYRRTIFKTDWILLSGIGLGWADEDRAEIDQRRIRHRGLTNLIAASAGPVFGGGFGLLVMWVAPHCASFPAEMYIEPFLLGAGGMSVFINLLAFVIGGRGGDGWYVWVGARELITGKAAY